MKNILASITELDILVAPKTAKCDHRGHLAVFRDSMGTVVGCSVCDGRWRSKVEDSVFDDDNNFQEDDRGDDRI